MCSVVPLRKDGFQRQYKKYGFIFPCSPFWLDNVNCAVQQGDVRGESEQTIATLQALKKTRMLLMAREWLLFWQSPAIPLCSVALFWLLL